MTITAMHRSALRVISKATALEFLEGIRDTLIIRTEGEWFIRFQPGNLVGFITDEDLENGTAIFMPNVMDEDGAITYHYRKYINAWLRRD